MSIADRSCPFNLRATDFRAGEDRVMWEWGRARAEYAAETAWTRTTEEAPKYGEPEVWAEAAEGEREDGDGMGAAARDPIVSSYDLVG
jgi:hypothetical protein